jgi:hypothetical protein
MADFIQLEQQCLAHDFQCADLARVLLLRQKHLSVASLSDLGKNLEIALPQASATLPKIGAFAAKVLSKGIVVLGFWRLRRRGVLRFELSEAVLAGVDVGQEVVVVVEEVCGLCK